MNAVITLEDVKKSYQWFDLDIPRLEIPKGYITGFIGENGAGKTTTLRMIMNLISPDSGTITVLGGNLEGECERLKQEIGYVDNLAYFTPNFQLGKAKSVVAPFYRDWDESLFQSYVRRFHIRLDKKIKDLSTGQSKLFSLVMALSHRPKLLILDEPTSGLDPVVRNELLDILSELLQDSEISIFYSTHITSDLEKTADYIAYIRGGCLLLMEEKDRMLEEYRIVKGEATVLEDCRTLLTGTRITSVGATALTRNVGELTHRLGSRAELVVLEKPTLEDIMIYTAKGAEPTPERGNDRAQL